MAAAVLSLLLALLGIVPIIQAVPVTQGQCLLQVLVEGKRQSVSDVLKAHRCSPTEAFTYYAKHGSVSAVGQDVCTGLETLVGFSVKEHILDRICSKVTFENTGVSVYIINN